MPEPKLPDEYAYGYVVARAIRAVADSTPEDDPYPDGPPVEMRQAVTFRPIETGRIIKRGAPEPSIRAQHEAIIADLEDGYLSLNGQRGLWLYTGTWQVTFADALGWSPYQITVTTDHTIDHPLDLFTAPGWTPPDTSTQAVTLLVPATVADGDVLIRRGDHVDGVPQERFRGPAGPVGPVGPVGPAVADTGWIDLPTPTDLGPWVGKSVVKVQTLSLRRIGSIVMLSCTAQNGDTLPSTARTRIPEGFQPDRSSYSAIMSQGQVVGAILASVREGINIKITASAPNGAASLVWATDDPWPT